MDTVLVEMVVVKYAFCLSHFCKLWDQSEGGQRAAAAMRQRAAALANELAASVETRQFFFLALDRSF